MRKIISVLIAATMILILSVNVLAFSDTENHWAKEYIDELTGMGAIKGRGDGLFYPYDTITRAEFTAILLRSIGNDVGQLDSGKWYNLYMQEAENKGLIKDGEYSNVEQNISRLEIAKMITRALNKEQLAAELQGKDTGFKDDYFVRMADKGYLIILKEYGVINGTPEGYFLPDRSADRAEATKMIVTFLENSDIDLAIKPDNYAQGTDGIYIYEYDSKQEQKVITSNVELMPHIKKAIDTFASGGGYTDTLYSKEDNHIQFYLYKDKAEAEKPMGEQDTIMSFHVYTEQDPRSSSYLPYQIHLYNTKNSMGQKYVKTLIKDLFPQAYDTVVKELQNKVNDTNYENKVWEDIAGREIRIFTFKGHNQIDIYIAPEK